MSQKKKPVPTIRSSAAEYLSFVAASGEGGVEAVYADEDVWLSQKMMGVLYDVATHTINYHLKKYSQTSDSELEEDAVIRNFRITAKAHAISEFEKYSSVQDSLYQSDFDKQLKALENLENKTKQESRKNE